MLRSDLFRATITALVLLLPAPLLRAQALLPIPPALRAAPSDAETRALPFTAHMILLTEDLPDGQVLSAWIGARMVGSGAMEDGKAVVLIQGDDPHTPDSLEGARAGEPISFKVGTDASHAAFALHSLRNALTNAPQPDVAYRDDAVWVATADRLSPVTEPETPLAFELGQNFPNPFNPTTTISYTLDTAEDVQLEVYNMLGQRVRVLVSEHKQPGRYEVSFEAEELASGAYVYRLRAGDRTETRRMVLLK